MKVNIGIEENERKKIADGLSGLLADSYTLYLRTHNFHWNVTGQMSIHRVSSGRGFNRRKDPSLGVFRSSNVPRIRRKIFH
jgi:hypothetical protein